MNSNRMPWVISVISLVVALIACFVAMAPRVAAQDPAPAGPVVAAPVDGALEVEPAQVDPAAVDAAVSNAITYQGVLRSGSAPATGSYDFQFQLFNAVTAGTQRGSTLVAENVPVSQGRFTTILNFGNVFGSEALWIAVGVRAGTSTGAFTALTPRQSLTAVPFAATSPALQAQVNTLKTQVTALQSLLGGVTSEDNGATLRITNRNLQVVSGTGATYGTVTGRGNIIIGYNEARATGSDKSGSHMLIVGDNHNYSSYGGIVVGRQNTSSDTYATVTGGELNTASGIYATVSGGSENVATAVYSTVSGGKQNQANGNGATVAGGTENQANGGGASVSGGSDNHADGTYSVVSGGYSNVAAADDSTVGGGQYIIANGLHTWNVNYYNCIPSSVDNVSGC